MSSAKPSGAKFQEHIFEVRFKPNAQILDRRGELASHLSSRLGMPEWNIGADRIDLRFDSIQSSTAFLSYRNFGVVAKGEDATSLFEKLSKDLLLTLAETSPISGIKEVLRLGVKSKFAVPSDKAFSNLLANYQNRWAKVSEKAIHCLDGNIVDIGVVLDVRTAIGTVKTQSGPMGREQLILFFDYLKDQTIDEEVFYYAEYDYWKKPFSIKKIEELKPIIDNYFKANIKAFTSSWSYLSEPQGD